MITVDKSLNIRYDICPLSTYCGESGMKVIHYHLNNLAILPVIVTAKNKETYIDNDTRIGQFRRTYCRKIPRLMHFEVI
jgi:hypothetical protein